MNKEAEIKEIEDLIKLRKRKNKIEHDTCIVGTKALITLLEMYKAEKKENEKSDCEISRLCCCIRAYERKIKEDYISKDKIETLVEELKDIMDIVRTGKDEKSKIQSEILGNVINKLKKKLLEE